MSDVTNGGDGATVRITIRDVYDAVQGLKTDLSRVAGQMESHTGLPNHPGAQVQTSDHEMRLRKLEKVAWAALGIATVLSPVIGILLYVLGGKS